MWRADPWQLAIAFGLDVVVGDPRGWPHVVRWTGALAVPFEKIIAALFGRTVLSGALLWSLIGGVMLGGYVLLHALLGRFHPGLAWGLEILIIYQAIATRDLDRHVRDVLRPLSHGDLPGARAKLAWIVGRDTAGLDETEISRAGIESVAESVTDGIAAPLFWALVAGAPGALIYRIANTLDSLVGHRDARYERMGKVSARIDDLLSWIPARLTALMFWCWHPALRWSEVAREARLHASPNAGWSESAMARVLGVRLGGLNHYRGEPIAGPVFNPDGRPAAPRDLSAALSWMWKTSGLFFILCLLVACLRNYHHAH